MYSRNQTVQNINMSATKKRFPTSSHSGIRSSCRHLIFILSFHFKCFFNSFLFLFPPIPGLSWWKTDASSHYSARKQNSQTSLLPFLAPLFKIHHFLYHIMPPPPPDGCFWLSLFFLARSFSRKKRKRRRRRRRQQNFRMKISRSKLFSLLACVAG